MSAIYLTQITATEPVNVLPRPRLFAAMDEMRASPFLWIGGPAGSGKTALVASYISSRGMAAVWCRPGPGGTGAMGPRTTLAHFLETMPKPDLIILEDSHQVPASALLKLAAQLETGIYVGVQLMLIARTEPPPDLVPLIAKGVVAVLSAPDLRFTFEEMCDLAAPLKPDESTLKRWHENCQGWALGIAIVLDEVRRHPEDPARAVQIVKRATPLVKKDREQNWLPAPERAGRHWPWRFKVHVLGQFGLMRADAPVRISRRTQHRPLELLQALIAFGGTDVGVSTLVDALWPDADGDSAYHALESTLYRLRQLLGAPGAVRMAGKKLTLDGSLFWVDLWEFERELERSTKAEIKVGHGLRFIRQLYTGRFLEHETDKPWALNVRHGLHDRFLRYIREVARSCEHRRLWQEAVKAYQTGLELDALGEDLYRGLMVCQLELGDHSEALQTYTRCRELLTRMLGVPPNPKTVAVYHSVCERASAGLT
jgi:DNA-binding SARP family transcriptional activator